MKVAATASRAPSRQNAATEPLAKATICRGSGGRSAHDARGGHPSAANALTDAAAQNTANTPSLRQGLSVNAAARAVATALSRNIPAESTTYAPADARASPASHSQPAPASTRPTTIVPTPLRERTWDSLQSR